LRPGEEIITTKGAKYTKVREENVKAFSELRVLRVLRGEKQASALQ
jgi:hypothetical protein